MRKKQTPGRKRKRSSRTVSDTEQELVPLSKRADTNSSPVSPPTTMENKADPHKKRSVNEIYDLLVKVSENQNTLKQSLEQRITDLEIGLRNDITIKMRTLKEEIDLEFTNVDDKIESLKHKIETLENSQANTQAPQAVNTEITTHSKLVFKNVQQNDLGESENALKDYVNDVIKAIGLGFSVLSVDSLGSQSQHENNTDQSGLRRKRPILVTLENDTQRSEVMKNKRKLKDHEHYKNIYIEPDKSRHERIQEANIRQIVKSMPNFQIRGGRVVKK